MGFKRKPETVREINEICLAVRHLAIVLHDACPDDTDVYFDEAGDCILVTAYGRRWNNSLCGKIGIKGMSLKAITKAALEMALGFKVEMGDCGND